jgi:hypothetical protein
MRTSRSSYWGSDNPWKAGRKEMRRSRSSYWG